MSKRAVMRRGIERRFGTSKAAARYLNLSEEMVSRVLSGERNLAPDLMPRAAGAHLMIGMAIAQEATGYQCFSYIDGDRHPQTMIRRVEKEDAEADEAIRQLPWLLIDKHGPDDLSPEEHGLMLLIGKQICDRIKVDTNLVEEMDDRFQLGLIEYLTEKEKRPLQAAK